MTEKQKKRSRRAPAKDTGKASGTGDTPDPILESEDAAAILEIDEAVGPENADGIENDASGDAPEDFEIISSGKDAEKKGAEKSADGDNGANSHRVSRKEVLARLLEKNEIILKLSKEKLTQDKQLKELNDKWMRSVAEFENYRKRTRKEWELLKQQAKSEVILDILHVVDDFERAFSVAEDMDNEFIQGIKLIYNNLTHVLERSGIKEIEALHEPFDPNYHMAIGQVDNPDGKSGTVVEVVQKGYFLDDTVIRPANVIVAK